MDRLQKMWQEVGREREKYCKENNLQPIYNKYWGTWNIKVKTFKELWLGRNTDAMDFGVYYHSNNKIYEMFFLATNIFNSGIENSINIFKLDIPSFDEYINPVLFFDTKKTVVYMQFQKDGRTIRKDLPERVTINFFKTLLKQVKKKLGDKYKYVSW